MGYKQLDVWRLAMSLVVEVYKSTTSFPKAEQFGLTSQIRRAAVSIPSNLAEGYGRRSPADYVRFLRIAKGSVNELETLLILSVELGYLTLGNELESKAAKVGSMLSNLITSVEGNVVREIESIYGVEDDIFGDD